MRSLPLYPSQYSNRVCGARRVSGEMVPACIASIERNNPHAKGKLGKTFQRMRSAVPDHIAEPTSETLLLVQGTETDTKDQPILAAAIDGSCSHLITFNLTDFDISFAMARNLAVMHPDEFLEGLLKSDSESSKRGMEAIIAREKNPPMTIEDYSDVLSKLQMPKAAAELLAL